GLVNGAFSPSDFALAEKELRYASELSPSLAVAPYDLGICFACQGRLDEALREFQKARELDPISSIMSRAVALPWYLKRDYARTFQFLRDANDVGAAPLSATWEIGVYIKAGSLNQAFAELEKAQDTRRDDPLIIFSTGAAYAAAGKKAEALAKI